jgi:hypothetical protein
MTCRGRNGGAGVDTHAPLVCLIRITSTDCDARFSHGVTIPPPRSHPSLSYLTLPSSLLFAFCKRHGCHISVLSPISLLFTPSFVRCGKKAPSTDSKWAHKADPTGRRQSGMQKANRMILVQKPSHGVLLAERVGRESLVQSFQSGIRFLWLFAHEPDR